MVAYRRYAHEIALAYMQARVIKQNLDDSYSEEAIKNFTKEYLVALELISKTLVELDVHSGLYPLDD